jgi:hypothetical protein
MPRRERPLKTAPHHVGDHQQHGLAAGVRLTQYVMAVIEEVELFRQLKCAVT